jgi:TctA family transporter
MARRVGRTGARDLGLRFLHRRDPGLIGLTFLAPPLPKAALKFGPPEYFALMVLGLIVLTFLSSGSIGQALMMASFGLLVGSVGPDTVTGTARFTFWDHLAHGLGSV